MLVVHYSSTAETYFGGSINKLFNWSFSLISQNSRIRSSSALATAPAPHAQILVVQQKHILEVV